MPIDYGTTPDNYLAGLLAEQAEAKAHGDKDQLAAVAAELAAFKKASSGAVQYAPDTERAVVPSGDVETR